MSLQISHVVSRCQRLSTSPGQRKDSSPGWLSHWVATTGASSLVVRRDFFSVSLCRQANRHVAHPHRRSFIFSHPMLSLIPQLHFHQIRPHSAATTTTATTEPPTPLPPLSNLPSPSFSCPSRSPRPTPPNRELDPKKNTPKRKTARSRRTSERRTGCTPPSPRRRTTRRCWRRATWSLPSAARRPCWGCTCGWC